MSLRRDYYSWENDILISVKPLLHFIFYIFVTTNSRIHEFYFMRKWYFYFRKITFTFNILHLIFYIFIATNSRIIIHEKMIFLFPKNHFYILYFTFYILHFFLRHKDTKSQRTTKAFFEFLLLNFDFYNHEFTNYFHFQKTIFLTPLCLQERGRWWGFSQFSLPNFYFVHLKNNILITFTLAIFFWKGIIFSLLLFFLIDFKFFFNNVLFQWNSIQYYVWAINCITENLRNRGRFIFFCHFFPFFNI